MTTNIRARRAGALLGFVLIVLACAPWAAPVGAQRVEETTLAVPALGVSFAASFIAEELGLWEREQLRVQTSIIPAVGSTNALLSRSVDFTVGTAASFARVNTRGQRVVAIMQLMDRLTVEIVLRRDVADKAGVTAAMPVERRAQALRGRRIAVDGFNAMPHLVLKYVARKAGIDAERDLTVTPMQPPSMLAALKSGAIDGFAFGMPWTVMAVRDGTAVTLLSTPRGELAELYPFAFLVILTRPEVCEAKPTVCRKLVAGYRRALETIHERPADALAVLMKRFDKSDPAILAESFELVRLASSRTGRVDEAGLRRGYDLQVEAGVLKPEERLPPLAGLYTNRFLP